MTVKQVAITVDFKDIGTVRRVSYPRLIITDPQHAAVIHQHRVYRLGAQTVERTCDTRLHIVDTHLVYTLAVGRDIERTRVGRVSTDGSDQIVADERRAEDFVGLLVVYQRTCAIDTYDETVAHVDHRAYAPVGSHRTHHIAAGSGIEMVDIALRGHPQRPVGGSGKRCDLIVTHQHITAYETPAELAGALVVYI